jgi:hypothetical protein
MAGGKTKQKRGVVIDLDISAGPTLRMAYLMTHYRGKMTLDGSKLAEAKKALRRFALACEPNLNGPPVEIVEAIADDLNTPKAIAIMHRYRKQRDGKKLFAALRFLGFFGATCLPDEIKTLPEDHIWAAPEYIGFDTLGAKS